MVATATANGCGILVMLMENAGLAQAAWETARAFWATPSESLLGPVFRFVLRMEHWNNSKNYHIMLPVFYLFLLNYSISSLIHIWFWKATNIRTIKNLSFQRPYAPYASSPLPLEARFLPSYLLLSPFGSSINSIINGGENYDSWYRLLQLLQRWRTTWATLGWNISWGCSN